MRRKKYWSIAFFVVAFVFFFFPGSYRDRQIDQECVNKCEQKKASAQGGLNFIYCGPPIDGFSVSCLGMSTKGICVHDSDACVSWCDNACFGLVGGTGAAPGPFEAKVQFVKNFYYLMAYSSGPNTQVQLK